jgi:excisionase family DNA binding protein
MAANPDTNHPSPFPGFSPFAERTSAAVADGTPICPGAFLMSRALRPPVRALEPLLTIRQAADLMQVSDKTVRRRITDGSLIALRIGSQWRIPAM